VVVVLRHVKAGRKRDRERRVIEYRRRREERALDRERVQERLQRRACLARTQHAVDFVRA
jgi:hypothetical protein